MIDALKTFLAVAKAGSFSEVARQQDVAVSSVTRKIEGLESELSVRLFHRSPRRVSLTDAGEIFAPRARVILGEVAEARDELFQVDDVPKGFLSVTAPTAFGRKQVVPVVAEFLERYPQVEIDLNLSDDLLDLASSGVDVALRIGVLPDSDLVATQLSHVRLVTVASPTYIARMGAPKSPQELLAHECLGVIQSRLPPFVWRYPGVNRNQSLPVKGRFRTDDKDGMLQAALAGLGIAHIAIWMVREHLLDGRLVALFPQEFEYPLAPDMPGIYAVRAPGRGRSQRAKLFIDLMREQLQGLNDVPSNWLPICKAAA